MNEIQQELFQVMKKKGKTNFDIYEVVEICEEMVKKKLEEDRELVPSLERVIARFGGIRDTIEYKMREALLASLHVTEDSLSKELEAVVGYKKAMQEALEWLS